MADKDLLILIVIIIVLFGISIYDRHRRTKEQPTVVKYTTAEEHKLSYSLFMTAIQDYNKYFITYELSKVMIVGNNELLENEYKLLSKKYIEMFIDLHGESEMFNNVSTFYFKDIESVILYLKNQFDLILLDNYSKVGFANKTEFFTQL